MILNINLEIDPVLFVLPLWGNYTLLKEKYTQFYLPVKMKD